MATRMQQRRGTAAQWVSTNGGDGPILNAGEIGFESDTGKFKVGDGVNHWVDLEYFLNEAQIATDIEGAISDTEKGAANGVASLDSNAKLTSSQIPTTLATLASPTFTGTPAAPTAAPGTNTTQVATTAFVVSEVGALVGGAPETLNTLNELAAALGDDENYASTITTSLSNKQDKVTGVSDLEIGYLDGVTSSIQSQIDGKSDLGHNHLSIDITDFTEAAQDAVGNSIGNGLTYTDGTGAISIDTSIVQTRITDVSDTEIGYLNGVTSGIQGQLNNKTEIGHTHLSSDLTDITASAAEINLLDGVTASTAEINLLDGVTATTAELNILDGVTADYAELNILDGATVSTAELNILDGATLTTAELNYVDGVTSAIQTQLDGKSATGHTHTLVDVTDVTATAAELNILDGVTASTAELNILDGVTASHDEINILDGATLSTTELNYVDGVTSAIQTQLDDKLSLSGGTLTGNLILNANPVSDYGAATKAYVDSATAGLNVHDAVRVATTANVNLGSPLIDGDINNGDTIDGITLVTGDRVLVKNQTAKAYNGVYIVPSSGEAQRASDYNQVGEVDAGDFIFVQSGTVNGKTGWVQTNTITTIGTDDIEFTQFSGAGTYLAGTGLTLTGNTFSINTGTTVDTSTAQTLTNKTINGANNTLTVRLANDVTGTLPVANGGTGITSLGTGIATFLETPSSANLASAVTNETGSGSLVFGTSPTIATPTFTGAVTLGQDPTSALHAATKQYVDKMSYATASSGSATYTVTTANSNKLTEISHSSEVTVTVPSDASDTDYPIGTVMDFRQMGAGRLSFVWTSPATKVSTDGYTKSRTQYSVVTLEKRASNAWIIYGDIDA